jgi:ubiquinone/menaquinone biosynthesis C-methylase UbiE
MADMYADVAAEVAAALRSGTVVDVGTGPGLLPVEIAKRGKGLRVVGLDISPPMVRIAGANARGLDLAPQISFVAATAERLPFPDGSLDMVVSTDSLHHWSKPSQCIREIHRVLKPGHEAWIYDIRRDVGREVEAELRHRYGWFAAFLVLAIVRTHSSISFEHIERIVSSAGVQATAAIEEKGFMLKLRLCKPGGGGGQH